MHKQSTAKHSPSGWSGPNPANVPGLADAFTPVIYEQIPFDLDALLEEEAEDA